MPETGVRCSARSRRDLTQQSREERHTDTRSGDGRQVIDRSIRTDRRIDSRNSLRLKGRLRKGEDRRKTYHKEGEIIQKAQKSKCFRKARTKTAHAEGLAAIADAPETNTPCFSNSGKAARA